MWVASLRKTHPQTELRHKRASEIPAPHIWMNEVREIREAQKAWAESRALNFSSRGYVREVDDNLWRPLSPRARAAFQSGAGSELIGHMKALHSSSALAVNFFDYWTDRDKSPLLWALGAALAGAEKLDFESQFPTGLRGTPPHLDVAITLNSGFVIAIKSKFTEPLKRSTRGKGRFATSYFPSSGDLWTQRGLPECQALAEELHEHGSPFEYFDPGQLLKHALGLATQLGDRFSLYYLYYGFAGKMAEAHRREIERFDNRVGAELRFKALTYQEIYGRLRVSEQAEPGYVDYLGGRYFPAG